MKFFFGNRKGIKVFMLEGLLLMFVIIIVYTTVLIPIGIVLFILFIRILIHYGKKLNSDPNRRRGSPPDVDDGD